MFESDSGAGGKKTKVFDLVETMGAGMLTSTK
jgi:hypothetical protein